MAEKKTLGRQKISMEKIENEDDLYSSFSKCRKILYKRESDTIEKYDIAVGIITFSPSDSPLSFFHPTIIFFVDCFFSTFDQGSESSLLNIANTRIRIDENQVDLDNCEMVEETFANQTTNETDVEDMLEQIKVYNADDLKRSKSRYMDKIDLMLKNIVPFFSQAPQENAN